MYIGIVILACWVLSRSASSTHCRCSMSSIVLGIVLGSSLGYHMPISLLIAKMFHERRSFAFGIFRMGPGTLRRRSCRWSVAMIVPGGDGARQRYFRAACC